MNSLNIPHGLWQDNRDKKMNLASTSGVKMNGIGHKRGLPGIRSYLSIKNIGIKI